MNELFEVLYRDNWKIVLYRLNDGFVNDYFIDVYDYSGGDTFSLESSDTMYLTYRSRSKEGNLLPRHVESFCEGLVASAKNLNHGL